jgi:hypothetical protein
MSPNSPAHCLVVAHMPPLRASLTHPALQYCPQRHLSLLTGCWPRVLPHPPGGRSSRTHCHT